MKTMLDELVRLTDHYRSVCPPGIYVTVTTIWQDTDGQWWLTYPTSPTWFVHYEQTPQTEAHIRVTYDLGPERIYTYENLTGEEPGPVELTE